MSVDGHRISVPIRSMIVTGNQSSHCFDELVELRVTATGVAGCVCWLNRLGGYNRRGYRANALVEATIIARQWVVPVVDQVLLLALFHHIYPKRLGSIQNHTGEWCFVRKAQSSKTY